MLAAVIVAAPAAVPNTNPNADPCPHAHSTHGGKEIAALTYRAWSTKRWRDASPVKRIERTRLRHMRGCAHSVRTARYAKRVLRRAERKFREHRRAQIEARRDIRRLTPYGCGSYGRWALPCAIVSCESGYSWGAYNGSGAAGPYQLMPEWGRPFPVTSRAQKLEHHRIASRLWNGGSGASNWVCTA